MVNVNVNVQNTLVVPGVEERERERTEKITKIEDTLLKNESYLSNSRIPSTMSLT